MNVLVQKVVLLSRMDHQEDRPLPINIGWRPMSAVMRPQLLGFMSSVDFEKRFPELPVRRIHCKTIRRGPRWARHQSPPPRSSSSISTAVGRTHRGSDELPAKFNLGSAQRMLKTRRAAAADRLPKRSLSSCTSTNGKNVSGPSVLAAIEKNRLKSQEAGYASSSCGSKSMDSVLPDQTRSELASERDPSLRPFSTGFSHL
ncbi:hypothetical protein C8R44DRAFT_728177 [Mycena epipterygia]|nr:hypothetical protein C8R44DRAFT_728177 [Mycena epipterygia]